jgi:hypothetical protein
MANKITAHNAGWRTQVRFAGNVFWSGVCEFGLSATAPQLRNETYL